MDKIPAKPPFEKKEEYEPLQSLGSAGLKGLRLEESQGSEVVNIS